MGGPMKRLVIPDRPKEEDYFYSNPEECLQSSEDPLSTWSLFEELVPFICPTVLAVLPQINRLFSTRGPAIVEFVFKRQLNYRVLNFKKARDDLRKQNLG